MQEKQMVNDILSMTNSSLTNYAAIISQCENQQLRQTLRQKRDGDEQFQYQLFQMASQKGYYKPAAKASQQDIEQVKSQLMQG